MNNVERIFDELLHMSDKQIWEYLKSLKQYQIREIIGRITYLKEMMDKNLGKRFDKWEVPDIPNISDDDMLSVQKAAKELNYNVKSLYTWIKTKYKGI